MLMLFENLDAQKSKTQTSLIGGDSDVDDFKGIAAMDADEMVRDAIKGLKQERFEILLGFSSTLKFMSRVAPQFMLNQLSRPLIKC